MSEDDMHMVYKVIVGSENEKDYFNRIMWFRVISCLYY